MQLRKRGVCPAICAALFLTWLAFGCGDDNGVEPEVNHDKALELVAAANDSLGRQMYRVIEETLEDADSSFRPRELDFSGVHAIYEEALTYDPDYLDAKFGAAFTGLMLFLVDQDLNDLFDRFKYTYDTLSFNPFRTARLLPQISLGGPPAPDGIPLRPGGFRSILPGLMALDNLIAGAAANDPQISEIQSILETSLLPKIVSSRERMNDVLSDPEFTFTITPLMQGNTGANPIVIDRSDCRLFLATMYAAEAALHVFFARELDVFPYTTNAAQEAASQSSSFLDLKGGGVGANHMATAKSRILSAEAELETTIDHLLAEIGTDQTNDMIRVYPDDTEDLFDLKDSLSFYRSYFDGPKELQVVWTDYWNCWWDGQEYRCDEVKDTVTMNVDVRRFFESPMDNPKKFLPAYTITIQEMVTEHKSFVNDHFSRSRYWAAMDTIFGLTYPNDTPYFDNHLPDENTDEFYRLLGHWDTRPQLVFGWDDVGRGCTPVTEISCYWSYHMWDYAYLWRMANQVRVCYEWEANSVGEWTWPHPTFNGLLPGMTSEEIKDILFDLGYDWQKVDCEISDLSF